MIRRPRFRRHFHVVPGGSGIVFLFHETGYALLEDRLSVMLAPWLDGRHELADIAIGLDGQANILDVQYGVSRLQARGLIEDAERAGSKGETFSSALHVAGAAVDCALKDTPVAVTVFGAVDAHPVINALLSLGIRVVEPAARRIVLVDDYLHPALEQANRQAIRLNERLLLAKPMGAMIWVGPELAPPHTPCWRCLAMRLQLNRPAQALAASLSGRSADTLAPRAAELPPATTAVGAALTAVEAFKWIVLNAAPHRRPQLVTLDLRRLRLERHSVVRQPFCPECGERAAPGSGIPVVARTGDRESLCGGSRDGHPRTTYQQFRHHISPITGLLDRPRPRFGGAVGPVHIYGASHVFTRPTGHPSEAFRLRGTSCGAGYSPAEAKTAALCEALERYSGVFQGHERRVTATYRALGSAAIHPNACLRFSEEQFAARVERNRHASRYNWIPEPFDEDAPVEWAPVRCLVTGDERYVPLAYAYYGVPPAQCPEYCRPDSNGSAAGASLDDAILRAFLELVERDSVALWWYTRARRPRVAVESFGCRAFSDIDGHQRRLGRTLHVMDITTDLGIPAVAAVSIADGGASPNVALGFGAHLDIELAIGRALAEMSQMLAWVRARTGRLVFADPRLDAAFLRPDPTCGSRRREHFPAIRVDHPRDAVTACIRAAQGCGLSTLVLDQTRPDVQLPVVKVIVPGLRPWWPRFAPGRLYDVPARLGWIPSSISEHELNPVGIYF